MVVRAAFGKASQGVSRVAKFDNFRVVFLVLLKLEFESSAMDMRSTCYADRNECLVIIVKNIVRRENLYFRSSGFAKGEIRGESTA